MVEDGDLPASWIENRELFSAVWNSDHGQTQNKTKEITINQ